MNTLEKLELIEAEETLQEKEKFKIEDLNGANWALRKISAYQKKMAEIKQLAEEEQYRLACWEIRETESIESSIEYFESLLAEYLIERRKENPKYKITTPYGKVSTRKQPDKWEYKDKAVLEYLKSIDAKELIRIKEELNKADLKKVVTVEEGKAVYQGVAMPGITIIEQPEKVIVSVEI